jgi:hypothetical protein
VRRILLFAFIQLAFLTACGGNGDLLGGSGSTTTSTQVIASAASNVAPITVDPGPSGVGSDTTINIAYVNVTVCAPGSTTNCQTIDHVQVDTGSYGLRLFPAGTTTAGELNSTVLAALPLVKVSGVPVAECTVFADGFSWGSVRTADITISGESAANVPIQIMGDPDFTNIPSGCSSFGTEEDTVPEFGANGILGIGPFVQDCGDCTQTVDNGYYYTCTSGGGACGPTAVALTQEVSNPVAAFTTDSNGVIVELPAVSDTGSLTVTGALVFGIGTESNNALGSATVLTTDDEFGYISTTFNGTTYPDSYVDSGSNFYYFNDSSISTCGTTPNTVFCPSSQLTLSATNEGQNGTQSTFTFYIADANTLYNNNPSFTAFDNIGAPQTTTGTGPQTFDIGLPFFYGRNVFYAIAGASTSGGDGPYVAY